MWGRQDKNQQEDTAKTDTISEKKLNQKHYIFLSLQYNLENREKMLQSSFVCTSRHKVEAESSIFYIKNKTTALYLAFFSCLFLRFLEE